MRLLPILILPVFVSVLCSGERDAPPTGADTIEVYPAPGERATFWARHVLSFRSEAHQGNPFEIEIDAVFRHAETGRSFSLPGYYAGQDTWKISFMPTLAGRWDWATSSADRELNGRIGSIVHEREGSLVRLAADPQHPRKWRLGDRPVIPIALRCEFFAQSASTEDFAKDADFILKNGILMLETRLTEEYGQFGKRHDFVFEGDWRKHQFDLAVWDRMQERMDILAARGGGAHVMLYSDDDGKPGWQGRSITERLVLRYVIARLAAYPVVMFNTGIDIAEYRTQFDIDWLGAEIRRLDPYDHPVSSRSAGGSGKIVMASRTFESWGDQHAKSAVIAKRFLNASLPVSMDDAWIENGPKRYDHKNHSPEDIRRGVWKCVVGGGAGTLLRGGGGRGKRAYYYLGDIVSDLESEQWLRLVNPFVRDRLAATFAAMVPDHELAKNGWALADPDRTKIVVLYAGRDDRYDPASEGPVTLRLAKVAGTFAAEWFDPRTGKSNSLPAIEGGADRTVSPPSKDDWILLLSRR
jgi:hypothetical protein